MQAATLVITATGNISVLTPYFLYYTLHKFQFNTLQYAKPTPFFNMKCYLLVVNICKLVAIKDLLIFAVHSDANQRALHQRNKHQIPNKNLSGTKQGK